MIINYKNENLLKNPCLVFEFQQQSILRDKLSQRIVIVKLQVLPFVQMIDQTFRTKALQDKVVPLNMVVKSKFEKHFLIVRLRIRLLTIIQLTVERNNLIQLYSCGTPYTWPLNKEIKFKAKQICKEIELLLVTSINCTSPVSTGLLSKENLIFPAQFFYPNLAGLSRDLFYYGGITPFPV